MIMWNFVGVTADHVFFCVSDPTEDVFDVGKHPFAFAAQYISAKYLVSNTKGRFHKPINALCQAFTAPNFYV